MIDLRRYQKAVNKWAKKTYPQNDVKTWRPLVGLVEELGELAHAFLKLDQGVHRNTTTTEAVSDAVGDLMVFLLEFCENNNIDIEEAFLEVWEKDVSRRTRSDVEAR